MNIVEKGSAEYPERMKELPNMPKTLYYLGRLPEDKKPSIAIVGARGANSYGRIQAFHFARYLSDAGIQVLSGLARGIDSEAHKGALEGKTPTFAIMGNGADICYPASNKNLYARILEKGGGIISEYPPGTKAMPYSFPARNRIISALSDVVLIAQAREKSGSLITAGAALEQGKSVYAIPGPVNDDLQRGCHKLIYDGAGIAYEPSVLMMEWGIFPEISDKKSGNRNLGLEKDAEMVYISLDSRPRSLDYLIRKTSLPSGRVSSILVELTLMGYIREVSRHYYVKV